MRTIFPIGKPFRGQVFLKRSSVQEVLPTSENQMPSVNETPS